MFRISCAEHTTTVRFNQTTRFIICAQNLEFNRKLMSKCSKSITIIAVASNEAAYLTEWIHHHFYFGFDKIVIGVNRTTDKTVEVINRLKLVYGERLQYKYIDFIDKSVEGRHERLQHIGYSYLVTQEIESDCVSQFLIIDIDEFWVTKDFKTSISEYCKQLPEYHILSFPWIFEGLNNTEFLPPFKVMTGYTHQSENIYCVKSLFKQEIYDDVEIFAPHRPKTNSRKWIRLDSKGRLFEPYVKGFTLTPPVYSDLEAFILHRAKRSEIEYLAGQFQLDNFSPNRPIKPSSNRYRNNYKLDNKYIFSLDLDIPDSYFQSLNKVIKESDLERLLTQIRSEIRRKANNFISQPTEVLQEYGHDFMQKSFGTYAFPIVVERIVRDLDFGCARTLIFGFLQKNNIKTKVLIEQCASEFSNSNTTEKLEGILINCIGE